MQSWTSRNIGDFYGINDSPLCRLLNKHRQFIDYRKATGVAREDHGDESPGPISISDFGHMDY